MEIAGHVISNLEFIRRILLHLILSNFQMGKFNLFGLALAVPVWILCIFYTEEKAVLKKKNVRISFQTQTDAKETETEKAVIPFSKLNQSSAQLYHPKCKPNALF